MRDAHSIARRAAEQEAIRRAQRAARLRDGDRSPLYYVVFRVPIAVSPDPSQARPPLLLRLRARLAAAVAWLLAPPACEHCGAELRVYDVWYAPTALLEPTPVYLWHCRSCEPLEARDPA